MRVATHQPAIPHDEAEALACIRDALADAQRRAIDLVCFPECYVRGYTPNDREATARAAYDVAAGEVERLVERIGRFDPTLVVGLAEQRPEGLFNTALVIRRGELVGRYAKARPNEAFFEPGDAFPSFPIGETRFGINICNDANFPEVAAAVAAAGARGIVMPLNNLLRLEVAEAWRHRSLANLHARARETGCWVVSSDIVGTSAAGVRPARVAHGCSAVVGPRGDLLARVPEGIAGAVVCEVP